MGLSRLAALHGVATSYSPSPDATVSVPDDTVIAVLAALGVDAGTPEAVRRSLVATESRSRLLPPTVVVWAGEPLPPALTGLPPGSTVRVEPEPAAGGGRAPGSGPETGTGTTGGTVPRDPAAPAGWTQPPYGIHRLHVRTPDHHEATATLVVAPARVPQPPERTHGFLVQLYSLLSARSWGMGDLGDLADLAAWAGRTLGSGFVQVNPLHAAFPGRPTDPSPYRPSSRRFPDPVHLHVESIPEYGQLHDRALLDDLRQDAAALSEAVLNKGALIDRDAVWELKRQALELIAEVPLTPGRRAAYCDFLAEQGQALEDHALWCALAEEHGPDWHAWPEPLRDPRSPATARARARLLDRVDLHCRLAWLTATQLADAQRAAEDAGMEIGIVHDLAVGVHPAGADTWAQRDAFAHGMSVGAPPDAFNARGQDWGLPPWRPDALATTGYASFRGLLRGLLAHAGALRIDHVMGLFRLWWVPEGRPPTDGTYVSYDAEAMLAVLVLEAHRAGAVVVGRTWAPSSPASARRSPGAGCSAPPCSGSSATGAATAARWPREVAAGLPRHRHHPRSALHRRPADRRSCDAAPPPRPAHPHPGGGADRGRHRHRRVAGAPGPAADAPRGRRRRARRRPRGPPLPGRHPRPDDRRLAPRHRGRPPPAEPPRHLGPVPQLAAAHRRPGGPPRHPGGDHRLAPPARPDGGPAPQGSRTAPPGERPV